MRTRLHQDAVTFLASAQPFFETDPFSANVIAVVAARVVATGDTAHRDRLWVTVHGEGGHVVGLGMHTPPHPLFVSRMPQAASVELANALADDGHELSGVNGASESTSAFAETWSARTGQTSTVITAMRMYRLEKLTRPRAAPGNAILALTPNDVDLVANWLAAFHAEATPRAPSENWSTFAQRRIAAGQIHLWQDEGNPVSLAAVSAPAAGVARIGPVYTPAALRRKGYGAAVTSEATSAATAVGAEHVVLYTDLANPTSNSIYQAIGYRPDHDAEERVFQ
jgi:predicted GNAT family acetyltransferase